MDETKTTMPANSDRKPFERARRIGALLVLFLYLGFLFPSPEYPVYNADDGSFFVTMALNLTKYHSYTTDTFWTPAYGHHATWPVAFPTFLAVIIQVFGVSWLAMKLAMALCGLGTLWLLYRYWNADRFGMTATALTALSPMFFLYSHHTMTEIPYLFVVIAVLTAMKRTEGVLTAFGAGLLGLLAFMMRGYAVTLLPAAIVYYALRPWGVRMRVLSIIMFVAPMILGIVFWKYYTASVVAHYPLDLISSRYGTGADFLNQIWRPPSEYLRRFWQHDGRYMIHFFIPLIPLSVALGRDDLTVVSILIGVLICYGWVKSLRRGPDPVQIWLPVAILFLLVPKTTSTRYWFIYLPFFSYFLVIGLDSILKAMGGTHMLRKVAPLALLLIMGTGLAHHLVNPNELRFANSTLKDYRDIAVWARDNLPADAVVAAPAAHRFYSVALRRTFPAEKLGDKSPDIFTSIHEMYLLCQTQGQDMPGNYSQLCSKLAFADHSNDSRVRVVGTYALYRMKLPSELVPRRTDQH